MFDPLLSFDPTLKTDGLSFFIKIAFWVIMFIVAYIEANKKQER